MKFKFKVVVIGDLGVGKTSLIKQFVEHKFTTEYLPTMGVDLTIKDFIIDIEGRKEVTVRFQLWDIAGQEKWTAMKKNYYKGSAGVIVVYDVTRIKTFNNIEWWISDFIRFTENSGAPRLLLSNKMDLKDLIKIPIAEGRDYAEERGFLDFFGTSALSSLNVDEAFKKLAKAIYLVESKK